MKRADLQAMAERHGLTVDGTRQGAGKFVDLEVGTGGTYDALNAFRNELIAARGCANLTTITMVNNPDHEQYGKAYVLVGSFWNG